MADQQDEGDKVYKCGHCGVISRSIEELKFHMLGSHLNEAGTIPTGGGGNDHPDPGVDSVGLPLVSESGLHFNCHT